jgi:hypothetical protein
VISQQQANKALERTAGSRSLAAAAHCRRYAYMRQRIGFDPVGLDGP